MPQRRIADSAGALDFRFDWTDSPRSASTAGRLLVCLNGKPIWHDGSGTAGIESLWVELLEYFGRYWKYLVLEEGYPFYLHPESPSGLRSLLDERWSNNGFEQSRIDEEETVAVRFQTTHNLAECSPGTLRPDILIVRDGDHFVVEASTETGVETSVLPEAALVQVLSDVAGEIAARIEAGSEVDERSRIALLQWEATKLASRAARFEAVLRDTNERFPNALRKLAE